MGLDFGARRVLTLSEGWLSGGLASKTRHAAGSALPPLCAEHPSSSLCATQRIEEASVEDHSEEPATGRYARGSPSRTSIEMSALYALGKRDMTRAELEDRLRRHVARKLSDVARRAERKSGSARGGSRPGARGAGARGAGAKGAGGRARKTAREGDETLAAIVARIERLGLSRQDAPAGREDAIALGIGREPSVAAVPHERRDADRGLEDNQERAQDPAVPDAEITDAWIAEVMEKMLGSGFVDDVRTATGMVRRALSRGEGMTRIRGKLAAAGLGADDLGAGVASGSAEFLLAASGVQGELGDAPADVCGDDDCGSAESVREAERRACMAFMRRRGMGPWRVTPGEDMSEEETPEEAVDDEAAADLGGDIHDHDASSRLERGAGWSGKAGQKWSGRKGVGGGRPRESAADAARRRDMAALIRRGFGFDLVRDLMALDPDEAEAEAARDPGSW